MTLLLIVSGVVIAFVLALLRALALDEVRGRIQRRVEASVEATISSLPPELQEEWAEEWRAELAAMKSMPLSAITFARGLRETAAQLASASELSPARARPAADRRSPGKRIGQMAPRLSARRVLASLDRWSYGFLDRWFYWILPSGLVLIVLAYLLLGISFLVAAALVVALIVLNLLLLDER